MDFCLHDGRNIYVTQVIQRRRQWQGVRVGELGVEVAGGGVEEAEPGEVDRLPLSLFRSRTVSVAVATGFAFMAGYYGLPLVMSLYLPELRGLSALGTGVVFLPMMLTSAVLTLVTARPASSGKPAALVGR